MIARALGPHGTVLDVEGTDPHDVARRANALRRAILARRPDLDVVAGGDRVLVAAPLAEVRALVDLVDSDCLATEGRGSAHTIDVVYDGEDLADVAARAGVSVARVIALHSDAEYTVEVVGFLPGFGYLGEVPPELRVARRASPRPRVPAGSVAIAGRYAGIYPFASPGGWHLLGRAMEPALFDPTRAFPTRFAPGDRVRFRPVNAAFPEGPPAIPIQAEPPAEGDLEIVRVSPHATIQDLGRHGLRGAGVPTSGAWDRATHVRTNRALGNPDSAATIELPLGGLEAIALRPLVWSVDGDSPRRASPGDRIEVPPAAGALHYFGVAGGVDVPVVLGSRSTLVTAAFGGHRGRRLRRGDRLPIGLDAAVPASAALAASLEAEPVATIRVTPGPELDELPSATVDALLAAEWTLSNRVDRTGARLDGARAPHVQPTERPPRPTVPGAVQITPDGTPIVLGPDAAVTGGYPIALVLGDEARDMLARLRPGQRLRFLRMDGFAVAASSTE